MLGTGSPVRHETDSEPADNDWAWMNLFGDRTPSSDTGSDDGSDAVSASSGASYRIHPSKPRNWCKFGRRCVNFWCQKDHPAGRTQKCRFGKKCNNEACRRLHPKERMQQSADSPAPEAAVLKTAQQRALDRAKAGLPILKVREQFCCRLEQEGILVVTGRWYVWYSRFDPHDYGASK